MCGKHQPRVQHETPYLLLLWLLILLLEVSLTIHPQGVRRRYCQEAGPSLSRAQPLGSAAGAGLAGGQAVGGAVLPSSGCARRARPAARRSGGALAPASHCPTPGANPRAVPTCPVPGCCGGRAASGPQEGCPRWAPPGAGERLPPGAARNTRVGASAQGAGVGGGGWGWTT